MTLLWGNNMCFECFRNSSPEHMLVKLLLIYTVNRYENINNINVYHSKTKEWVWINLSENRQEL